MAENEEVFDVMHPDRVKLREAFGKDFFFYAKTCGPGFASVEFSKCHEGFIDDFFEPVRNYIKGIHYDKIRTLLCYRGFGKTTLTAGPAEVYAALYYNVQVFGLVSKVGDFAINFLDKIHAFISGDPFLSRYGKIEKRFSRSEGVLEIYSEELRVHAQWIAKGIGDGQYSGMNYPMTKWIPKKDGTYEKITYIVRPQWWILDDIVVEELKKKTDYSVEQMSKWFYNGIMKTFDPGMNLGCTILATIFEEPSFITEIMKNPTVKVVKIPVLNIGSNQEYITERFGVLPGESTWEINPDFCKKNIEEQIEIYNGASDPNVIQSFYLQMILEPWTGDNVVLRDSDIPVFDSFGPEIIGGALWYILIDGAYREKEKTITDDVAIVLVGKGSLGNIYVKELIETRLEPKEWVSSLVDILLRNQFLSKFKDNFVGIGIESIAFPMLREWLFQSLIFALKTPVAFFELRHCNVPKFMRIKQLFVPAKRQKLIFSRESLIVSKHGSTLKDRLIKLNPHSVSKGYNGLDALGYIAKDEYASYDGGEVKQVIEEKKAIELREKREIEYFDEIRRTYDIDYLFNEWVKNECECNYVEINHVW